MNAKLTSRLETIQKHLRGVKKRLLWILLAFGVGASLTWYFRVEVMLVLLAPGGGSLSQIGPPIFTSPTEMLSLAIRLAVIGGIVAASPVLVFHVARFLSPLLNRKQNRLLAILLPSVFVCYLAGTAFAYFVLLPIGLRFLLQFGTDVAVPMIRITEYMSLAVAMLFWLGVVFELPLVMLVLTKLRVVSYKRFKYLRRYVPATAFILSAIITPTFDIVNQTLVAVPMIVLYEVGLFLSWLAREKPAKVKRRRLQRICRWVWAHTLERPSTYLLRLGVLLRHIFRRWKSIIPKKRDRRKRK